MPAIRRAAAIHDLSGFGRCALTVVLPVLSAMGIQCCPVPTALLSAHMAFPGFSFLDLTDEMDAFRRHWAELDLQFDAIYSGFLGSQAQMEIVRQFITQFSASQPLILCDPVMGDHGKLYRNYTPAMCHKMSRLAADADVITPNLTEAALLLGKPCDQKPRDETELKDWLYTLSLESKRSVIITGFSACQTEIGIGLWDKDSGQADVFTRPFIGQAYCGTGDLFAGVLLGRLLQGWSLRESALNAAAFVSDCVTLSWQEKTPAREGVRFETLLSALGGG